MNIVRPARLLGALALASVALVACGDDDDTSGTTTTEAPDDGGETIAVTAVDYGFEGLPGSISAGATLTLSNDSDVEVHELVAFRLPDGEDRSVEDLLALPEEELSEAFGGEPMPTMVLIAPPGEDGMAVVGDGSITEPGRYAIACFIPTGADPEEFLAAAEEDTEGPPDVEGGPPHFVNGMFAELNVT